LQFHLSYPFHIIIFFTNQQKQKIITSKAIFIDGTFKACPEDFIGGQLLNFIAFDGIKYCPVVHVLMDSRTEAAYSIVFRLLKSFTQMKPNYFQCDFEKAMRLALQTEFPDSDINGCFFHFRQALNRMVEALFKKRTHFLQRIEMLLAHLPFLEQNIKINIIVSLRGNGQLDNLLCYFVNNWMSLSFALDPTIPITNNTSESFNHKLSDKIGHIHPNIVSLASALFNMKDEFFLQEENENQNNIFHEQSTSTRKTLKEIRSMIDEVHKEYEIEIRKLELRDHVKPKNKTRLYDLESTEMVIDADLCTLDVTIEQ
jgi:hypothetical protein